MPVKRVAATVSSFCFLLLPCLAGPPARADATADSLAAPAADSVRTATPPRADSSRIVRVLPPVLVHTTTLDVMSSEARRRISAAALHELPVDRVADVLALEPGVVVDDGIVHVRGARPGELRVEMDGIALNEPFRGESFELPVVALDGLELIRGGREAEHGGGLAGTLIARPATAGERMRSQLLWETTGGGDTPDDRVGARFSAPVPGTGAGLVLGGEARLDDQSLPELRTTEHVNVLGVPVAWRARNQATALARVAPVKDPERVAVTAMVSRRLLRPFDPMFSLNGYVTPCIDPDCAYGPRFSPTPLDSSYARFDAADHYPQTDVRRATAIASTALTRGLDHFDAALGWNLERRLTSVGGVSDPNAITPAHEPVFGDPSSATSDPFHLYAGDTPYFRQTRAEWIEARAGWHREWRSGSGVGAGLGATHERVSFREVDDFGAGFDSVRAFRASAPGANGWVSARWVSEGLIANFGLHADWFSPGPQASQTPHSGGEPRDHLLLSPRFGLSFPLSVRDAFQAAYERLEQAPGREYLYDDRTLSRLRPAAISPRHPMGNPLLEPSAAISWEAVLRHRENALWSGTAGFFWRDIAGEVGARHFTLPNGQDALRYESIDVAHALGLELTVERDRPGKDRFAATYTWMQTSGSESFEDGVPFYPLRLPQPPPITEFPLAWDQAHRLTVQAFTVVRGVHAAWTTVIASGLPWTPARTRQPEGDLSLTHSRRLPMFTLSDLALKGRLPGRWSPASLGLDVRNVFDWRGQKRVSIDGYPNGTINTQFDDYTAHREATSTGGAAWWDDAFGWVRVSDPRLDVAPRMIRLVLEVEL